ncbi:MAG: hypothetical protein ACRYHQ_04025 [Janthinobacterium lividum]
MFTPEQTATIRQMRPAGAGWRAIAAATGRSHVCCRRHWLREMGGVGGWARARGVNRSNFPGLAKLAPVRRPPLPAGSAASWGAITCGTAIDGSAYQ